MKPTICSLVVALCWTAGGPVQSATIQVEAEAFTSCQDIALEPIRGIDAPSCTGGLMLVGLDWPDEWADYALAASELGEFKVSMKCRGDAGIAYSLRLTLTGDSSGDSQTIYLTYQGVGYG